MRQQRGFTLIELLVVLAIMAGVMVGVRLSLRDDPRTMLQKDAQRLIAQLEATRSLSRTSGVAWVWRAQGAGYTLQSLNAQKESPGIQTTWLSAGVQAQASTSDGRIVLGPEPIIAPAWIALIATDGKVNARLQIATDGLRSFEVQP